MIFRKYLVFVVVVLACSFANASFAGSIPYKAKTADECVQEKECVWHHFFRSLQSRTLSGDRSQGMSIKKWKSDIRFKVVEKIESPEQSKFQFVKKLSDSIRIAFPYELRNEKKYNFLVLLTPNIEGELSGEFKAAFDPVLGKDAVLNVYRALAREKDDKCYYLSLKKPVGNHEIVSYFAFVQTDNPDIEACIREAVYSGLGLQYIQSPLLLSYANSAEYSKLEILLNFFFYRGEFYSGMSAADAEKEFFKIYAFTIKEAKSKKII